MVSILDRPLDDGFLTWEFTCWARSNLAFLYLRNDLIEGCKQIFEGIR